MYIYYGGVLSIAKYIKYVKIHRYMYMPSIFSPDLQSPVPHTYPQRASPPETGSHMPLVRCVERGILLIVTKPHYREFEPVNTCIPQSVVCSAVPCTHIICVLPYYGTCAICF